MGVETAIKPRDAAWNDGMGKELSGHACRLLRPEIESRIMQGTMDIVWLKVPAWEKREGLVHGFLGRKGGRSRGGFAGLNLSVTVGDDIQTVKDNLCDVKKAVGVHELRVVTMTQRHGDRIIDVRDKRTKNAGEADGMATEERETFLGVLTADCVPILFSIPGRRLAAVVHAGWRGTLAGLPARMVDHLGDRYRVDREEVEIALGPAIGPCCYEIRDDVSAPLLAQWGDLAEGSLRQKDGHRFLDLRGLIALLLKKAGVSSERIFLLGPCTACAADDFFSYRRDYKDGNSETGRQLSFIGWL